MTAKTCCAPGLKIEPWGPRHVLLRVAVGDDVILDAVIDRTRNDAAIEQVDLGAVGPESHNASGPTRRHAWNFEQLARSGVINIDAGLGRRGVR